MKSKTVPRKRFFIHESFNMIHIRWHRMKIFWRKHGQASGIAAKKHILQVQFKQKPRWNLTTHQAACKYIKRLTTPLSAWQHIKQLTTHQAACNVQLLLRLILEIKLCSSHLPQPNISWSIIHSIKILYPDVKNYSL